MRESKPPPRAVSASLGGPIVRILGALIGSLALIALIHVAFAADFGRYRLLVHRALVDRFLGLSELSLSLHLLILGLPAAALLLPFLQKLELSWVTRWHWSPRTWLWMLALGAPLVSLAIATFCTQFAWFTDDEQAYLFQARAYWSGALSLPVLEPRGAFLHHLVVDIGERNGVMHWAGVYPPLQPLLVGLSELVYQPQTSQLVCVGLIVFHTGRLAEEWFEDRRLTLLAAALCAVSPMLLGLATTLHSSVLATTLSVLAARVALAHWRFPSLLCAAGLGLLVGLITLTRPMEGAIVLFLVGATVLARGVRSARAGLLGAAGLLLGGALPLGVFLLINRHITGHWLETPYGLLARHGGRFFGFGENLLWGRSHSLGQGLGQWVGTLSRLNNWLFGWPACLAGIAIASLRPYRCARVGVLVAISVCHFLPYLFFPFGSIHDFGSAYHLWHLPWFALVTSYAMIRVEDSVRSLRPEFVGTVPRFAVAMTLVGIAAFWPMHLRRWADIRDVVLGPIHAAEQASAGRRAIVFWQDMQPGDEIRSWVFRPPTPDVDAPLLWLWDHPAYHAEALERYPDRIPLRLSWHEQTPVVSVLPTDEEPAPSIADDAADSFR